MLREGLTALLVAAPFGLGVAAGDTDEPRPLFRFEDPAIVESSGLVAAGGLVVTVNDSGDEGRVFVVDPATGQTVGVTRWDPEPEDVEALAPGRRTVWVGDIGDNPGDRDTISVIEVPYGATDQEYAADQVRLRYPDGPHDAETLLAHPRTGRLYVVTKDLFGGEVYEAPRQLDPQEVHELRPLGRVMSVATDGAFFPDGAHLVLRNYGRAVVYSWPELEEVGEIDLPAQQQGEGIAVDEEGRILISSEGQRSPVYEVGLPRSVERAMAAATATPSEAPAPSATPSTRSRAGEELPEEDAGGRDPTQWLIGTGLLVVAFLVLLRALRPRGTDPLE